MVKGKILGVQKEQIDYRAMKALNQSFLKVFDENPVAFYNECILGIKRKKKEGDGLVIGDLSDFYTLECNGNEDEFNQRLDDKFSIFEGSKGTGQVFVLADILAGLTERDTNEKGEVTSSFINRFTEAFSIVQSPDKTGKGKYAGKTLSQGMDDFEKNGKEYFEKKIQSFDKSVATLKQIEIAKRVSIQLLTDPFTAWIYKDAEGIEIHKKFPINWEWVTLNGEVILCKSEVDILHIDHNRKLIYLKDQKVTYDNENFEYSYLKYKYYLQNAFYYQAVDYWRKENGMKDYDVVGGMDFVVGDSSFNGRRPLIYRTSMSHIKDGLNGFITKSGYEYRGVGSLIEEINFCIDNNSWNCSKEAYERDGILELKKY